MNEIDTIVTGMSTAVPQAISAGKRTFHRTDANQFCIEPATECYDRDQPLCDGIKKMSPKNIK